MKIDQIIRSRRKTIGLMINAQAQLIIRAPHWTPVHEIERLIQQKQDWIYKKQELFRKRARIAPREFKEGEEFLFLGESYKLRIVDDLPKAIVLEGDLLVNSAVIRNVKDHLGIWYKTQALQYISQRVKHYATLTGVSYSSVKVNNAKTRWGSCSYTDNLNFTWRLVMAPPRVIDYVVVHELMHLKQRNHSARFWMEVARVIPDYKIDEAYLKNNGYLLR